MDLALGFEDLEILRTVRGKIPDGPGPEYGVLVLSTQQAALYGQYKETTRHS